MRKTIPVLLLILISYNSFAQSKLAMSFTGSYNLGMNDLHDNFENGFGINTEIYYFFNDSPFSLSFSIGTNVFNATDEYETAYTDAQQDIIPEFSYHINQYSIPLLFSGNYRFFRTKKFQPAIGISIGLYSVTDKFKQTSKHFSDTRLKTSNEFGAYPHISFMYKIATEMGIILKGGYNQTFGTKAIAYADIRLGLIYKI